MNTMNPSHPINPPSFALIKKWIIDNGLTVSIAEASAIASLASRLGADQELEACCEWLDNHLFSSPSTPLRAARRPNPPSLKEQALKVLQEEPEADDMKELIVFDVDQVSIIRRALEQLPDD